MEQKGERPTVFNDVEAIRMKRSALNKVETRVTQHEGGAFIESRKEDGGFEEKRCMAAESSENEAGTRTPPRSDMVPLSAADQNERMHATPWTDSASDISLYPDRAWKQIRQDQLFLDVPTAVSSDVPAPGYERSSVTRLVCMSDTHGKHREVHLPKGDVLIHGGDFTSTGETKTILDLSDLFRELLSRKDGFREAICIAGNHDLTFQPDFYKRAGHRFHSKTTYDVDEARRALTNCIYLEDEPYTIGRGSINVFGSPWQPEFCDWAFNLQRGSELRAVWSQVPADTDVLITHGPPLGRGDKCKSGSRAGCYDLLREVQDRIKPRVHVFGHIHEGYGVSFDGATLFVNASNLNFGYQAHNPCVVIDMPHNQNLPPKIVKPSCNFTKEEFLNWLEDKGNTYKPLVESLRTGGITHRGRIVPATAFPEQDGLLDEGAFQIIYSEHMDPQASFGMSKLLRSALSQLFVESF